MWNQTMNLFTYSTRLTLIIALCAVLLPAGTTSADSITLKPSVRLQDDAAAITLGAIAQLEGEHAQSYADLVIAPLSAQARAVELSVDVVRNKLNEAGVHWGRVNLNGRHVIVRPSQLQVRGTTLLAMKGVDLEGNAIERATEPANRVAASNVEQDISADHPSSRVGATAAALSTEQTVRGHLARLCAQALRMPAQDLRLEFSADDRAWISAERLFTAVEADARSRWTDDRVVVKVTLWKNKNIVEERVINVWPRVRVSMLTLNRNVSRNARLSSDDFDAASKWVTNGEAQRLASADMAVGMLAVERLREGQVLFAKHLRGDTVVRRGDMLSIRCLVGGVTVTVTAEAREDGAVGDEIAVRMNGEREEFRAEIISSKEAVFHVRNRH